VAPGLYASERRAGALFIVLGTVFCAGGPRLLRRDALYGTMAALLGGSFKAQLTLQSAFDFESRMPSAPASSSRCRSSS
jgi:hypothetical protein